MLSLILATVTLTSISIYLLYDASDKRVKEIEHEKLEESLFTLKTNVSVAKKVLQTYYLEYQKARQEQTTAPEELEKMYQQKAKDAIRVLRFEADDGYFWIQDNTPTMLMHPDRPELESKSLIDNQDANGKYHNREIAQKVLKEGKGIVHYAYVKPKTHQVSPKVAYFELFEPWGWTIATGILIEHIQEKVNHEKEKLYMSIQALIIKNLIDWRLCRCDFFLIDMV